MLSLLQCGAHVAGLNTVGDSGSSAVLPSTMALNDVDVVAREEVKFEAAMV